MNQPDQLWSFLPFWIVNYGLAIVVWSCIGRFLLSWAVPAIQPQNYIWRAFVALTEWSVRLAAFITPRYVRPIYLPLIAAFWLYWFARPAAFVAFVQLGLAPRLVG
jgi:fucose permease